MKRLTMNMLGLLLVLSAAMLSCKKDAAPYGPPTISRVSTTTDQAGNLQTGSLNQWLIIWGRNLANTQTVQFNDLTVARKDLYSNDTMVSVKIPRQIPTTSTNLITLTTATGTTTYNFNIVIPQLTVSGLTYEYTPIGDTLEIRGNNFDLYGFEKTGTVVTFTGGQTASLTAATATSLKLVVPSGAQPGALTIKGVAPLNRQVTTNAWYKDNRNMLLNMPFTGWNGAFVNSHPDFPNNPAPMLVYNKTYAGGWGWDPFMSGNINFPAAADGANAANYVLKFEVNTKVPISKGGILFRMGNDNLDYHWKPYNDIGAPLDTKGKWVTISIPLNLILKSKPTDHGFLEFVNHDGDATSNNFAIANLRIVPK